MSDAEQVLRKSVTRTELSEAVYVNSSLSRSESAAFVGLVLEKIANCLEQGEAVKLSSFGSFLVRKKGPRMARNPKTGEAVPVSPRKVMVFKPSPILRKRIAAPNEQPTFAKRRRK